MKNTIKTILFIVGIFAVITILSIFAIGTVKNRTIKNNNMEEKESEIIINEPKKQIDNALNNIIMENTIENTIDNSIENTIENNISIEVPIINTITQNETPKVQENTTTNNKTTTESKKNTTKNTNEKTTVTIPKGVTPTIESKPSTTIEKTITEQIQEKPIIEQKQEQQTTEKKQEQQTTEKKQEQLIIEEVEKTIKTPTKPVEIPKNTITEENKKEPVVVKEKYTLYHFTADWCGPCQVMKPIINKLMPQYTNIIYNKVDLTDPYGDSSNTANKYNVTAIPTLIIVDSKGNVKEKKLGMQSEADLKKFLEKYN